jgi:mannose-6-phosphate isomerase-like protein (cupin superfamily)
VVRVRDGLSRTRIHPDPGERFVSLRRELGVTTFGCNQIVLGPRQRGRIHRHERQEEVYFVLEGTLTLLIEGEKHVVQKDELVRLGPELRRQLVNRGSEPLVVLALGGSCEHHGRDGMAYADWDSTDAVSPQDLPLPPDLPG